MGARGKDKKESHERPPSEDDIWLAETNKKCALAMVHWLKSTINTRRAINTMNIKEMESLAGVAWSTMIVEIGKRAASHPESEAAMLDELYLAG